MPALHIRDVPDATIDALKRRAARHGHSVQQELRELLERAVTHPSDEPEPLRLTTVATGVSEPFDRDDFYDEDR